MSDVCPECGNEYENLGQHWSYNSEHRPSFSDYQKEVITGSLMGDGNLHKREETPYLRIGMISPNYLEYIDNIFGCLSNGVRLEYTGDEGAKSNRKSGFRPNAKGENYSDLYMWSSRTHPQFQNFDWYESGTKVWPEDIELTPVVLKHWYCQDGHYHTGNGHIRIAMSNEIRNTEKVSRYFELSELPEPNNYTGSSAYFTVDQSEELWKYMGEPLPGFEYKWPDRFK